MLEKVECCFVLTSAVRPFVAIVSEPFVACTEMATRSTEAGSISADCLINHTYV